MSSHESYLAEHPFFKNLEKQYIKVLADNVTEREIKSGDIVFRQDAPASSFYVIREGGIEVRIPSIYGPPIVVQTLSKNQLLGFSWLIPPYKWHFEACATEDGRILEFNGEALRAQCDKDPKMGYELIKHFAELMADRVQAARMRVMEVCAPPETV